MPLDVLDRFHWITRGVIMFNKEQTMKFVTLTAAGALFAGAAYAGGVAPAPYEPAPMAPAPIAMPNDDWTGGYAGLSLGYARGDADIAGLGIDADGDGDSDDEDDSLIDDFADSYARGETPIPCVRCNQTVKFRDLLQVARDLGADALATGHYVRRLDGAAGPELHRAVDPARDQSYFLFATTQEQLGFLRFPLGDMEKSAVREHAAHPNKDPPKKQPHCRVQAKSLDTQFG